MRNEAFAAASLVFVACANLNERVRFNRPLGIVSRLAALNADRMDLGDEFGDRKQVRHRPEWRTRVILVKARDYHPHSAVCELICNSDDL